ncbi:uncharacterized protein LOC135341743 isoform X2 [Halichondria panicea]|uniref:uncharacterized protein LOC135341743 isoform X1 n=1 Tax=Halichondria panicea TaxID=6063 RepID=UPI00312BA278
MERGQTTRVGVRKSFPPPSFRSLCFTTICEGFRIGKEDHYYALSIRNTIVAAVLFAWLPMLISVVAIFIAKKAQKLDIEGNTAEAEEKANLAKKLNIAANITTTIYSIVVAIIIIGVVAWYTTTYYNFVSYYN